MYELIRVRPATIKRANKKGAYINANGRKYLEALNHYTSLRDGTTYIFNEQKTKVKRITNYI
jgi:hypothetical protein